MANIKQVLKGLPKKLITVMTCLLVIAIADAQQPGDLPESLFDDMLTKFRKIQKDLKTQKEYEKELETSVDEAMVKLDKWLAEQKRAQAARTTSYKPSYKHTGGDINLFPVWEEMPGPVPSLPEAKQTDFHGRYDAYVEKVTVMKKQISEMIEQHLNEQRTDQKSMISDSKVMADQNAMVRQMGGADAVMKMSEQERKLAAKQASMEIRTDPGKATGIRNEGMNVMAKRMMSDPEYRKAYSNMTEAQKEAELKKYMGNTTEQRNDKAFENSINNRNATYSAAGLELLLGKSLQQMQEAAKPYSEGTELANNFYNGVYKRLDTWYQKTYNSLPETNTREKIGVDILIKCKESILYAFQKKEAATRTILWTLLKENTKIAIGEFNDYVGRYKWDHTRNAGMIDGIYTEPRVAKAIISLYDEMIRMTGESERLTRMFKGQQEQYELIMK